MQQETIAINKRIQAASNICSDRVSILCIPLIRNWDETVVTKFKERTNVPEASNSIFSTTPVFMKVVSNNSFESSASDVVICSTWFLSNSFVFNEFLVKSFGKDTGAALASSELLGRVHTMLNLC